MNLPMGTRSVCFSWLVLAVLPLGSCRKAPPDNAEILSDNNQAVEIFPDVQPFGTPRRWFADVVCESHATNSIGTAAIVRILGEGGIAITASHVAASLKKGCPSPALRISDDCSLQIVAPQGLSKGRMFPLDIAAVQFANPQKCRLQTAKFQLSRTDDDGPSTFYIPARGEKLLDFSYEPAALKIANSTDPTALIVEWPDRKSTLGVGYSGSPVFHSPKTVLGLVTDRLPLNRDTDPSMTQQLLVQQMSDVLGLPPRLRSFLTNMVPASTQAIALRDSARGCPLPGKIAQQFVKLDAFDQIWLGQNLKGAVANCAPNYWDVLTTALTATAGLRLPDLERADLVSVANDRTCGKETIQERRLTESLYYDALGKLFVSGPDRGKQFKQSLLDRALCQADDGRDAVAILMNLRLMLLNASDVGLSVDPGLLRVFGDSLTRSAMAGGKLRSYIASFRIYELCLATVGCPIKIDELSERAGVLQDPTKGLDAPITEADTPDRTLKTEAFVKWLCTRASAIRFADKGNWGDLINSPPDIETEISAIEMQLFGKFEPRSRKSYEAICSWKVSRKL